MVALPIDCMVKAQQALWTSRMTVYKYPPSEDADTGITDVREEPEIIYQDLPCRLSFDTVTVTEGEHLAEQKVVTTLFCAPDLLIPSGSRIVVQQRGREYILHRSGIPSVYTAHQQIPVTQEIRYA